MRLAGLVTRRFAPALFDNRWSKQGSGRGRSSAPTFLRGGRASGPSRPGPVRAPPPRHCFPPIYKGQRVLGSGVSARAGVMSARTPSPQASGSSESSERSENSQVWRALAPRQAGRPSQGSSSSSAGSRD